MSLILVMEFVVLVVSVISLVLKCGEPSEEKSVSESETKQS